MDRVVYSLGANTTAVAGLGTTGPRTTEDGGRKTLKSGKKKWGGTGAANGRRRGEVLNALGQIVGAATGDRSRSGREAGIDGLNRRARR